MRIAVNCRSILLHQRTGIGRYTYHLLDSLGRIDPVNTYLLHAPKRLFDFKRHLPDFRRYKNFKSCIDYFGRGAGKTALTHLPSPDVLGRYSGRLVVTIHDLVYKTCPESHTPETTARTQRYIEAIAARADRIICISENTRRDLHSFHQIPLEKTCVVYNGVDRTVFYPLSEQERPYARQGLKTLGIDRPFVLYVGTIEPRKNLTGLLESFALLKTKKQFLGQLVVVGMKGWMLESIAEKVKNLGLERDLVFTGFIRDEQLRWLYNTAEVFVFPSLYEGFGFPILEAFSCRAAVITSKTSSCGEITQAAAVTIDPKDTAMMAEAIAAVVLDKNHREALRRAGMRRAQEFSFERMARETLAVYQGLVDA